MPRPRSWQRSDRGGWLHTPLGVRCYRAAERCRYCFQLNCRPCAGDTCTWCRRHLDRPFPDGRNTKR